MDCRNSIEKSLTAILLKLFLCLVDFSQSTDLAVYSVNIVWEFDDKTRHVFNFIYFAVGSRPNLIR